jgi:hypothetical protein
MEGAVSATSSRPTPDHARRGGAKHPVLARLPDVSREPALPQGPSRSAEPVEYVDYRFDSAMGEEDETAPARRISIPHGLHRPRHARPSTTNRASRILPDSDPFSLQTTSIYERLEPVVRFLILFALFTAAGTMLLIYNGRPREAGESRRAVHLESPPISIAPLEPTRSATEKVERTATRPTASGPLGADSETIVQGMFVEIDNHGETDSSAPTPALILANGEELPRVQTTEPAAAEIALNAARPQEPAGTPAVARLPGIILESPRQAKHDDNQPGLH